MTPVTLPPATHIADPDHMSARAVGRAGDPGVRHPPKVRAFSHGSPSGKHGVVRSSLACRDRNYPVTRSMNVFSEFEGPEMARRGRFPPERPFIGHAAQMRRRKVSFASPLQMQGGVNTWCDAGQGVIPGGVLGLELAQGLSCALLRN